MFVGFQPEFRVENACPIEQFPVGDDRELLEDLVAEQEVLLEGRLRLGGPDDEPPA
jgi:hypothetical protein